LILLDTNILLRYASTTDPAFATVDTAINSLHARSEVLCVVPQNVYEFWATIEAIKEGRTSHHSRLRLLRDGRKASQSGPTQSKANTISMVGASAPGIARGSLEPKARRELARPGWLPLPWL